MQGSKYMYITAYTICVFGIGRREHVTIIYPKLTLHVTHCAAVVPELQDSMSVLSVKC